MKTIAPKYIILDTNCFINAVNAKKQVYDYRKIQKYSKENEAYITISALTLYELIQGISRFADFDSLRDNLIRIGDFWVLGNGILDHKGIEYGLDFLFLLSMQSNEYLLDFAKKRNELREKVYQVLFNKIFFYAILVVSSFIYMSECDDQGIIGGETMFKIDYIENRFFKKYKNRYFLLFSEAYKHAGLQSYDLNTKQFYKDYNAKNELSKYLIDLFVQMLAVTEVELALGKKEWEYNTNEYNNRIIERCRTISKSFTGNTFRKVSQKVRSRTNGRITIERVLDELMANYPDNIQKECYHYLVEKLFNNGGFGKSINNDFIDFSNLVLIEKFQLGEAVYLTADKKWQQFMYFHKDNMYINKSIEISELFLYE